MAAANARLSLVSRHLGSTLSTQTGLRSVSTSSKNPTYRKRSDYKYFLPIQTRWSDNDQYGHINNSVYYLYIDTVVNEYLIKHCGLDPLDATKTKPIGLVVSSSANFYAPASYPSVMQAGLCITKLGRSSVTYRVGIFEGDQPEACVVGGFTHVFVDPVERRPVKSVPEAMKPGLQAILVPSE